MTSGDVPDKTRPSLGESEPTGESTPAGPFWVPQRLVRLAERIHAGLTAQGPDGSTVFANERAADLLGVQVADLLGSTSRDLRWRAVDITGRDLSPTDHPSMVALARGASIRGFVMGMGALPNEVPELSDVSWFLVDSEPVFATEDGRVIEPRPVVEGGGEAVVIEPVGVVSMFIPCADPSDGQTPVRPVDPTAWGRLQFLMDHGNDAFSLHGKDGSFLFASDNFRRLCGMAPEDLIGLPLPSLVHPSDVGALAEALSDFTPGRTESLRFGLQHPDRGWVPVQMVFTVAESADGSVEIRSVMHDVSAQVRAEQLAQEIIDSSPTALMLLDAGGIIERVNRAACDLLAAQPEQLVGTHHQEWTAPEDREGEAPLMAALIGRSLPRFQLKKRYRRVDGRTVWTILSAVIVGGDSQDSERILCQVQDIQQTEEARQHLQASEQRLRAALEGSPQGTLLIDAAGSVVFANRTAMTVAGQVDLVGQALVECWSWISDQDRSRVAWSITAQTTLSLPARFTVLVENRTRLFQLALVHLGDRATEEVAFVAHLVEESRGTLGSLDDLVTRASRDQLTGALSRAEFLRVLDQALRASRASVTDVGLIFCDLDGFKQINDTQGHAEGDAVLRTVAQALINTTRSHDVVGRYGGDEFIVMVPDVDDPSDIESLGSKLARGVRSATEHWGGLGLSLGYALSTPSVDADDLIRAADSDMYARRSHRRHPAGG